MKRPSRTRTALPAAVATAGLLLTLFAGSASPALATGTCPGKQQEVDVAADVKDPTLRDYDVNADGIICAQIKGRKFVYSDNRI